MFTQALTSSDGSRASRLIQERAEILEIELPSFTTSLLALVSFPVEEEPWLYLNTNISTLLSSTLLWFPDIPPKSQSGPDMKHLCTCGHVKEEGENASPVIASPQDSPWCIKRERQHSTRQFAGASFHFLPSGDVHHLQVMFAVANLGTDNKRHI